MLCSKTMYELKRYSLSTKRLVDFKDAYKPKHEFTKLTYSVYPRN